MSNMFKSVLTLTATAIADFSAFKAIGFDDQMVAADDALVKGVSLNPASAGMDVSLHAIGPIQVTANGAIALGAEVMAAADGNFKTASADPANAVGHALTAAADGDLVTILFR